MVQRPMTAGLQWFVRFFGRIKPARKPIDKLRVESAAALGGARQGLRSLEFRAGPEASGPALRGDRGAHTHRRQASQRAAKRNFEARARPRPPLHQGPRRWRARRSTAGTAAIEQLGPYG